MAVTMGTSEMVLCLDWFGFRLYSRCDEVLFCAPEYLFGVLLYSRVQLQGTFVLRSTTYFVLQSTTTGYFCTPEYNFRVLLYSRVQLRGNFVLRSTTSGYFCVPEYKSGVLLLSSSGYKYEVIM